MITTRPLTLAVSLLLVTLVMFAPVAAAQDATKSEPPVVTLIERGAEPHAPLRLRPRTGTESHRDLRVNITSRSGAGAEPMKTPLRLAFTTKVQSVDEEGDISYTLAFTGGEALDEPDVNPMIRQQMNALLAAMRNVKVNTVMSDRGVLRTTALDAPAGLTPMMRAQFEGVVRLIEPFSSPLPAEPVGSGAKWKVESKFERQGMQIKQTATYTLKAVRDGSIELAMELTQAAASEDVKTPLMPGGGSAKLLHFKGEGGGTLRLDLSEVIHNASRLKITNEAKVTLDMAGEKQEIEQHVVSEMSLSTATEPEKREGAE